MTCMNECLDVYVWVYVGLYVYLCMYACMHAHIRASCVCPQNGHSLVALIVHARVRLNSAIMTH